MVVPIGCGDGELGQSHQLPLAWLRLRCSTRSPAQRAINGQWLLLMPLTAHERGSHQGLGTLGSKAHGLRPAGHHHTAGESAAAHHSSLHCVSCGRGQPLRRSGPLASVDSSSCGSMSQLLYTTHELAKQCYKLCKLTGGGATSVEACPTEIHPSNLGGSVASEVSIQCTRRVGSAI